MAVRTIFSSVSTLASGAMDGPIRAVVEAVLDERGFVDPAAFAAAQRRLEGLEAKVAALMPRVEAAEQRAGHLSGEVQRLQSSVDDLTRDLADARDQTIQSVARADELEQVAQALRVEVEQLRQAATGGPGLTRVEDAASMVGPGGEVLVRGEPFFVDVRHAGKAYKVAHNGAVRVGSRLVKKAAAPRG